MAELPTESTVYVRSPKLVTATAKLDCTDHCRLLAMPSVPAGGFVVAVSFTTRFVMLTVAGAVTVALAAGEGTESPLALVAFTWYVYVSAASGESVNDRTLPLTLVTKVKVESTLRLRSILKPV